MQGRHEVFWVGVGIGMGVQTLLLIAAGAIW